MRSSIPIIARNERAWTYPQWLAARQAWADAHGGLWPVLDELDPCSSLDKPNRPFPAPIRDPYGDDVLPHEGAWVADVAGRISCREHGLTPGAH